VKTLPADTVIFHVDFVENYTLSPTTETQSEYFGGQCQITVYVHISHQVNLAFGRGNEEPRLLKDSHFFISDDEKHDTLV
jgi:hypothetical protein